MSSRIHLGEPIELPIPEEKLPPSRLHSSRKGVQLRHKQLFRVYIVDQTLNRIHRHIQENNRVETGGILVGHPFQNLDNVDETFIVITGAVRQDSQDRSIGHFTVGTQEIAEARVVLETDYPGLIVVGWYHSHPGHGVFLSGQDMQIVRSIYNANWHVAMVIDPIRDHAGFFYGPEGKRLHNWTTLSEIPVTVEAMQIYNQLQEEDTTDKSEVLDKASIDLAKLTEHRDMRHWMERGGYRDNENLRSESILNQRTESAIMPSVLQPESEDAFSTETDEIDPSIHQKYHEAKQKLDRVCNPRGDDLDLSEDQKEALLGEAKHLLCWVENNHPNYEDVKRLIQVIDNLLI